MNVFVPSEKLALLRATREFEKVCQALDAQDIPLNSDYGRWRLRETLNTNHEPTREDVESWIRAQAVVHVTRGP